MSPAPSRTTPPTGLRALAVAWLVAVVAGTALLWREELAAGAVRPAPRDWPAASTLTRRAGLPTLVMAVHPGCPCSRASLAELAVVLARAAGRLDALVLLEDGPGESDLPARAAAIPGVRVVRDPAGAEAARLQLSVSGETRLYDRGGRLVFEGGLTSARGHQGDSEGLSAVLAFLRGEAPRKTTTPAFGCGLRAPAAAATTIAGAGARS